MLFPCAIAVGRTGVWPRSGRRHFVSSHIRSLELQSQLAERNGGWLLGHFGPLEIIPAAVEHEPPSIGLELGQKPLDVGMGIAGSGDVDSEFAAHTGIVAGEGRCKPERQTDGGNTCRHDGETPAIFPSNCGRGTRSRRR